ncbi:MAG: DUF6916 family protein [Candidatus Angelobacter sp.]
MSIPLENLNAKLFREHLHTKFTVQDGTAGTVLLELSDAVEGDTSPKMELFSVYFRGPFTPRLSQQIHRLQHEKLGVVEIFLTAIEADQEKGTLYESVFHRFRQAQ